MESLFLDHTKIDPEHAHYYKAQASFARVRCGTKASVTAMSFPWLR